MQVICGTYDIRIKSYANTNKCFYEDILNHHRTCYLIRDFPDQISTSDPHLELTPYHVPHP